MLLSLFLDFPPLLDVSHGEVSVKLRGGCIGMWQSCKKSSPLLWIHKIIGCIQEIVFFPSSSDGDNDGYSLVEQIDTLK